MPVVVFIRKQCYLNNGVPKQEFWNQRKNPNSQDDWSGNSLIVPE
jgi:hypothetical protein